MDQENQEYTLWLERAEKDLKAAKNSLASQDYEWSCFQSHQAAEKALKAVNLKEKKELLKTHDIVLLARKMNASQEIINAGSQLNPAYTGARYPDVPASYSKEDAEQTLKKARRSWHGQSSAYQRTKTL